MLKGESKQEDEKPMEGDRDEENEEDDIEMKDPSMFIEN